MAGERGNGEHRGGQRWVEGHQQIFTGHLVVLFPHPVTSFLPTWLHSDCSLLSRLFPCVLSLDIFALTFQKKTQITLCTAATIFQEPPDAWCFVTLSLALQLAHGLTFKNATPHGLPPLTCVAPPTMHLGPPPCVLPPSDVSCPPRTHLTPLWTHLAPL